MNNLQMKWAKQHDWYIYSYVKAFTNFYTIVVRDDINKDKELEFTNFEKLTIWAGY